MSAMPLKVLIIGGSEADANSLLQNIERAGYSLEWVRVDNEADFVREVGKRPDVIIFDYATLHFSGPRVLELTQELKLEIPVLLIRGVNNEGNEKIENGVRNQRDRLGEAVQEALQKTQLQRKQEATNLTLREDLTRLASYARSLPDLCLILNEAGHCLDAIGPHHNLADQLNGRKVQDILPSDAAAAILRAIRETIHIGKHSQPIEFRLESPRGGRWFEGRTALLEPLSAADARVIMTVRDISEHKRAEDRARRLLAQQIAVNDLVLALGDSSDPGKVYNRIYEQVSRLMDTSVFIVSFYDDEGQMITAGHAVIDGNTLDVTRFPPIPLEAEGRGTQSQVIRSGTPLYLPDLRQALRNTDTEYAFREDGETLDQAPADNGTPSAHSAIYVPMKREGKTVGVMQVQSYRLDAYTQGDVELLAGLANVAAIAIQNARMVGQLEQAKALLESRVEERTHQLFEAKNHAETILNATGESIVVLDGKGRILNANPAFEAMTELSLAQMEARPFAEAFHSIGKVGDLRRILDTVSNGEAWRGEAHVRSHSGKSFDAVMTFTPYASNSVEGCVCTMRDISPLKEVALLKEEFVANVSHELRTPITGIQLNLELMERDPDHWQRYYERTRRWMKRLVNLIDDLLRLSRLEQGRVLLARKEIDLGQLVQTNVTDREAMAEQAQLQLRYSGVEGLIVNADEGLLSQVLSILLTNAFDYTPPGGSVTVSTFRANAEHEEFAGGFQVRDTGPGIPPEEQGQIFERFFRGTAGQRSRKGGTGLGLAIARRIIEEHGGRIELQSEGIPDKGSTFTVWLNRTL